MGREKGHAIQVAWRELRKHGEACDICADLIAELGQVSDDPPRADRELQPQFCEDGRELHGAWVAAKAEWLLDKTQGRREALGLVGLGREEAEVRARAIGALTTEQFRAVLALAPEPREGQLRALTAAHRHRHVLREVRVVARSDVDDRLLFRWSCECGEEAAGDYFAAEPARQGWARHAGQPAGVQTTAAGRPSWHRAGDNRRLAARPRLEGTDE